MRSPLDPVDLQLLLALQKDNRRSAEALGADVGLSTSACQRRLSRLRQDGVIVADVSVVAPEAVGFPMMALVSVTLERERADIIDNFKASIRRTPEVMQGFYVTGDYDFVLLVSARDIKEYESFTRRFFYENSNIKSFKTTVILDNVKLSLALPLDKALTA